MFDRVSALIKGPESAEPAGPRLLDGDLRRRLRELFAERARLQGVLQTESLRAEVLVEQLAAADAKRVDALTEARMTGDNGQQLKADDLSAEAAKLRRDIDDSRAVANRIQTRLESLNDDVEALRYSYRSALAQHLDDLYAQAMERYNTLAPEIADMVLRVAAIRRVMMKLRLGNTNGWSGHILLPVMRPKEGRFIAPLLDGDSQHYLSAADARKAQIEAELVQAGFEFGLE